MQMSKKNKDIGGEDIEITQKALGIRAEMIAIFEDLKHDPHNRKLLARFHKKCEEFNDLLKEINRQYEKMQTNLGMFNTKN